MTFKEYLDNAKARGLDVTTIETTITNNMEKEGFTKEQINSMSMEKVWSLWLDVVSNDFNLIFSDIYQKLEQNPQGVANIEKVKDITKTLEKEVEKLEDKLNKREKEQSNEN